MKKVRIYFNLLMLHDGKKVGQKDTSMIAQCPETWDEDSIRTALMREPEVGTIYRIELAHADAVPDVTWE